MKEKGKIFKIIIIFAAAWVLSFTGCSGQPKHDKTIYVIFRLDDIGTGSQTDIELEIMDLFRDYGASITFGVISFSDDAASHPDLTIEKAQILKQGLNEGILDIALHGYSHQENNEGSEFAGLDYDSQLQRLADAKSFLEGMIDAPVTTFVPPWNTYDQNTLLALDSLGFSTISAKMGEEVISTSSLKFLPFTSRLSGLRDSVQAARESTYKQPVIVVLFHEYDFKEISKERGVFSFQEFSELLNWLHSQEDVRILSINEAAKEITDLSASRFIIANQGSPLYNFIDSTLSEPEKDEMESLYREKYPSITSIFIALGDYILDLFPD